MSDVAVTDVDADGDDDIGVVSQGSGQLLFLEQTGSRALDPATTGAEYATDGFALTTGDFDRRAGGGDVAVITSRNTVKLYVSSGGTVKHADSATVADTAVAPERQPPSVMRMRV